MCYTDMFGEAVNLLHAFEKRTGNPQLARDRHRALLKKRLKMRKKRRTLRDILCFTDDGLKSERQEPHVSLPFAVLAALCEEHQVVNHRADGRLGADGKDAKHSPPSGNAIERILRQR